MYVCLSVERERDDSLLTKICRLGIHLKLEFATQICKSREGNKKMQLHTHIHMHERERERREMISINEKMFQMISMNEKLEVISMKKEFQERIKTKRDAKSR